MRIDAVKDALFGFLQRVGLRWSAPRTENTCVSLRTTSQLDHSESPVYFGPGNAKHQVRHITLDKWLDEQTSTQTQIARSLEHLEGAMGVSGSGDTENDRKKILILMTDGLEHGHKTAPGFRVGPYSEADTHDLLNRAANYLKENDINKFYEVRDRNGGGWGNFYYWGVDNGFEEQANILQVLDPAACQQLKDQGVEIVVMNIEYGVPGDIYDAGDDKIIRFNDPSIAYGYAQRTQIVYDLKPHIEPELAKCASKPELLFSVEEEDEMEAAFKSIFDEIYTEDPPRMTQ